MFSNTIEFSTDEKYIKNYPFCNPQPTKLNIPEWFKNLEKNLTSLTLPHLQS